jgi:hypothetical protein
MAENADRGLGVGQPFVNPPQMQAAFANEQATICPCAIIAAVRCLPQQPGREGQSRLKLPCPGQTPGFRHLWGRFRNTAHTI